ncbi:hypothetical protein AGDE_13445 [Angomonas deanei]|uniref:Uncharacterized protein n=1 Tax=Angomonas deanei TaxID=59799 RepID=A0A7G2CC42_9TRYP|nr:hypothetical protein AGDE_13445 [Angomonas deanei]CAD2216293.1 hypothetical protein, conserved [Angomonas deanei]|eukprot:EPY22374.1 hypothetical protein AGDE_13445 [Angomonas deanei]
MLNVRWVPYSTPFSEPQCPIHKKELQLFDPYSKELVCALCANNTDTNKSKLVVIPDVLGGDSRRRIQESVARQLDDSQRNAKLWLGQHQRIAKVADDRKEAINQQFDFFLSIVEAKRKQFLESCDAEFGLALSDVAREILLSDEKVQLLSAASDHLRTEATKPLYSMQIATIAEALEASDKYHNSFDKTNLQLPVSTQSLPNLESAIGAVQLLSPFPTQQVGTPSNKRKPRTNGITNSPYNVSNEVVFEPKKKTTGRKTQDPPALPSRQTDLDGGPNDMEGEEDQPSSRQRRGHNTTRRRQSTPPLKARGTLVATTPTRPAPTPPAKSPRSMKKKITRSEAKELYASNVLSVPNSTGTSLFDYAINDLFEECDNTSSRSQRGLCVEWTFRVEDPGDWVGNRCGRRQYH